MEPEFHSKTLQKTGLIVAFFVVPFVKNATIGTL